MADTLLITNNLKFRLIIVCIKEKLTGPYQGWYIFKSVFFFQKNCILIKCRVKNRYDYENSGISVLK